jgi:GNAT superfamily N-acetyltransferase
VNFTLQAENLDTPALLLEYALVPWDTAILGIGVGQITRIEVRDDRGAPAAFRAFEAWVERSGVAMVSCRMPHDALAESGLLESRGFRFVEMTLHPYLPSLPTATANIEHIVAMPASIDDADELEQIASGAFTHERFHVDPRIGADLSSRRYRRWIRNSLYDPRPCERVTKFMVDDRVAGFFVEEMVGTCCFWRLTALAEAFRGAGLGKRVWARAIEAARATGATGIRTTISARNSRVLGIYGRLGFRFEPPNMTFHWHR